MMLPSTWRRVRLGDICEINPRLPDELIIADDTKVSFLPMAAVDEAFGKIISGEIRLFNEVKKGFTPFVENDVLFAKITPSMENGKATIARNLKNCIGFGSTEFHVIRCSDQVLPEYVFYFIRQPSFRLWAKSSFVGSAGQQRVPADFLIRMSLLLPTLPEQQRIVEILKQAEAICHQRQEVLDEAKQIPVALFSEMFGNPEQWLKHTVKLGTIATFVTSGSRDWSKYYSSSNNDAKFIRVQNIKEGALDVSDMAYVTPPQNAEAERAKVQPGDLLISITGTVGQVAIVSDNIGEAYISQHVALVRTNGSLPADYLVGFINHPAGGQLQIKRENYGQTKPGLNLQQIKNMIIPLFDRNKIEEFFVKQCHLKNWKNEVEQTFSSFSNLQEAIREDAFKGKLTSSWREAHREELETWLRKHAEDSQKRSIRVSITETTPSERPVPARPARRWLLNQLSEEQAQVYLALQEWKGTLIPSEDLDRFLEEWPIEHLEDARDHVLRALNQLAGMGFINRVGVPNQDGDYVTAYRVLREEELTKDYDLKRLEVSS